MYEDSEPVVCHFVMRNSQRRVHAPGVSRISSGINDINLDWGGMPGMKGGLAYIIIRCRTRPAHVVTYGNY